MPQGSPVFPVLFILYLEPLLKLSDVYIKFEYADDIAILKRGKSKNNTAAVLIKNVKNAFR